MSEDVNKRMNKAEGEKNFSALLSMEDDELKATINTLSNCVGIDIPESSMAMVGMHLKIAANMAQETYKVNLEPESLELACVFNPLDFTPDILVSE